MATTKNGRRKKILAAAEVKAKASSENTRVPNERVQRQRTQIERLRAKIAATGRIVRPKDDTFKADGSLKQPIKKKKKG